MKAFWMILGGLLLGLQNLMGADSTAAPAVENGISFELARYRAAHVSKISYALSFSIPEEQTQPVSGTANIRFVWNGSGDLQLDFEGSATQLPTHYLLNDRKLATDFRNDHIVIPQRALRRGRNRLTIGFKAGDKSLNRHADYLYTLFVPDRAHTVFPCFDQPDLKAHFSLTLTLPLAWTAMSATRPTERLKYITSAAGTPFRQLCFRAGKPMPTYLFSFVAGRFHRRDAVRDGLPMEILYRETDSAKVAQLDKVFDQAILSLRWLERYTGIRQPFGKFGMVALPGYQFGGMEHPGAIQLNDATIFLGNNPTPDEELDRFTLIAHEVSHLWFGDLVTMRWFDDVWTKEVFANFMADKIAREQFPDIDHDLKFIKDHHIAALRVDRTAGTHPIRQTLDNLKNAGLIYGNIIYHKAPVMMRKLEEQMGEAAFRRGLQTYLHRYAFANSTWDDLINILQQANPQAGVADFDRAWVKQKGMPHVRSHYADGALRIWQTDIHDRPAVWKQQFNVALWFGPIQANGQHGQPLRPDTVVSVNLQGSEVRLTLPAAPTLVLLNYDGRGYGHFDSGSTFPAAGLLPEGTPRLARLMNQYEDLYSRPIADSLCNDILTWLPVERDPLVLSAMTAYARQAALRTTDAQRMDFERRLLAIGRRHTSKAVRLQVLRALGTSALSPAVNDSLYTLWKQHSEPLLDERDYMRMAYHLAMVRPAEWQQIVAGQRSRLKNADRQAEFDFIARGCTPDTTARKALFNDLLKRENRVVEPYAATLLALLNDECREPGNNRLVRPGLEAMQEVQRTGDIFFPASWVTALLAGHRSAGAARQVAGFLAAHPDYPVALKNKILQAAHNLMTRPMQR